MILVLVQGMFYKDKVKPIMFCFTCISSLLSPAIALFIGISRIRWN
nr:MAG TPA: Plasmid conjugative transfer entry exclusion protein TraS [Caudoviricetes sp.]